MDPIRVLIVDDEENNRCLLVDCLGQQGFELQEAGDGLQALEMVEQMLPDIILLDVMMPDLDGMAVLRKLQDQAHTRHIPVIMITALSDEERVTESLDAGAVDHISKPFSGMIVQARVRAALRNRDTSARHGKVFGFIGSKGGVGNTTVAVNVALSLASDRFTEVGGSSVLADEREVVLVDLRPSLGTIQHHLGISNAENLQVLLDTQNPEKISERAIEKCATTHSSGVHCLLAPPVFDNRDAMSGQRTEEILKTLTSMADYVILDLPSQPSEASRAALKCCDLTLLTVGLDSGGLAAAQVTLAGLASWGIGGDLLRAVFIAHHPIAESPPFVQKARSELRCEVISVIPPAGAMCFAALAAGQPVVLHQPDSLEATFFYKLAERLAGNSVPEPH